MFSLQHYNARIEHILRQHLGSNESGIVFSANSSSAAASLLRFDLTNQWLGYSTKPGEWNCSHVPTVIVTFLLQHPRAAGAPNSAIE